jgi:hypothetical protein
VPKTNLPEPLNIGHMDAIGVKDEIVMLTRDLGKMKNKISNPEKFIDHSLKIWANLSGLWVSCQMCTHD